MRARRPPRPPQPAPELLALRAALFAAAGVGAQGCIQEPSDPVEEGGAGAAGSAAGSSAGSAAGSAVTPPSPPCAATATALADGRPTGFEVCEDGRAFKVGPSACDPPPPTLAACDAMSVEAASCESDADCVNGPNGRCQETLDWGYPTCGCAYSCTRDEECGDGEVCACPSGGQGRCIQASCAQGGECASGLCEISINDQICGSSVVQLACRTSADACDSDADCPNSSCATLGEAWGCLAPIDRSQCPVAGRPALSGEGEAVVAPLTSGEGWGALAPLPLDLAAALRALSAEERAWLKGEWAQLAALEHASVASFARVTLELMALGAPADLLLEAQRAAADEVEHARAVYGLLAALTGAPAAPGPLAVERIAPRLTRREVARALVEEACVSEALGVGEVIYALELMTPLGAPREAHTHLARVCADETRHAALAWSTLRWLLSCADEESAEEGARLRDELAALLVGRASALLAPDSLAAAPGGGWRALNRLGALSPAQRREGRARAAGVVARCAEELLGAGRVAPLRAALRAAS